MAEEVPQPSTSDSQPDYSWVADEPRTTLSVYTNYANNIPDDMFTDISMADDWEIRIPGESRRICTVWGWGTIPMYQTTFEDLG
ncbi:hypothetical protein A2U01_0082554, partial [Trifolium medium]|nr:hypothetical protein [Trifolium medium]